MREHPLLGPRLLLVAPSAADRHIDAELLDRVEERDGLQGVAAHPRTMLFDGPSSIDGVLNEPNLERAVDGLRERVSERQRFRKVVTGVDVEQREWRRAWREGLSRQPSDDDRVLPARKQQHWTFELPGDLPEYVDGVIFKNVEMIARDNSHQGRFTFYSDTSFCFDRHDNW